LSAWEGVDRRKGRKYDLGGRGPEKIIIEKEGITAPMRRARPSREKESKKDRRRGTNRPLGGAGTREWERRSREGRAYGHTKKKREN